MADRDRGLELDVGNLAWAPVNDFTSVEMLDRFNGVPTLAVITTPTEGEHLVWRVIAVGESSAWLYVALTPKLRRRLEKHAPDLNEVLFRLRNESYATVGIAHGNRLVFEREFHLPPGLTEDETADAVVEFVSKSLDIALRHELPRSRKLLIKRAKRELVPSAA